MSFRSLAIAFVEGAGSARATSDTGSGATAPTEGGTGEAIAGKVIDKSSDAWWNAKGGPWCAAYRRFATLAAIGVGEGEPHREHFTDPFLALEHFRQLPDRYRTNETLRGECKIIYKDNWYMVAPFQDDADHAVDVMRAEVARDVRAGAA